VPPFFAGELPDEALCELEGGQHNATERSTTVSCGARNAKPKRAEQVGESLRMREP
jgi:hypothetical protein